MRAFVSHGSGKEESQFALELSRFLRRCFDDGVFYFEDYQYGAVENFVATINRELGQCQVFILLVGKKLAEATKGADSYQIRELTTFQDYMNNDSGRQVLWMPFPGYDVPDVLRHAKTYIRVDYHNDPRTVAHDIIVNKLHRVWRAEDDLPFNSHLFSLENDIAAFFQTIQRLDGRLYEEPGNDDRHHQQLRDKILNGCPSEWPKVDRDESPRSGNPADQDIVGQFRPNDSRVIVSARHIDGSSKLTFLEAGPRAELRFCGRIKGGTCDQLNVALLVSGGIAPGTNAVIDGIVQRHEWYARDSQYKLNIFGVQNGFGGLLNFDHVQLQADETSRHASRGGSILPTSRFPGLEGADRQRDLRRMAVQLRARRIDILYVIGGDGSMRAAHALRSTLASQHTEVPIEHEVASVVGVPKTMDNDVLWVWQSFGFLSAVEKAREILEHLSNEVTSNPRICVVQLFGSDSGFVVSHGVLATSVGVCDAALIPEVPFCTHGLTEHLVRTVFRREQRKARPVSASSSNIPSSMVVMAETAIPVDALDYENHPTVGLTSDEKDALDQFDDDRKAGRRIEGRTPDDLRNAGLKIVKAAIQMHIPISISKVQRELEQEKNSLPIINWAALPKKTLSSEPRHLLRAIPPNTLDLITAQRLGLLAVDNALAGFTDFMISQWLTEYVLVPLELVALGRKRIPENGMFWKSVVGKTGQPARMVCNDCQSKVRPTAQPGHDSDASAAAPQSNGAHRAPPHVSVSAGAPTRSRKQRRRGVDA